MAAPEEKMKSWYSCRAERGLARSAAKNLGTDGTPEKIAAHACKRSSGRVGRSALMRELHPAAIVLAVAAHVRHVHTGYDTLLALQGNRESARNQVGDKVRAILQEWQGK